MSVHETAASLINALDPDGVKADIKVCMRTSRLIFEYLEVSKKANIKLRLKRSTHPISAFNFGMQAIRFGERTSSILWLANQGASFTIYSHADFYQFLTDEVGDIDDASSY